MKRSLMLLAILVMAVGSAIAEPITINRSSFTQTNDTKYLEATYLDKVVVGVATSGGVLVIYNSTHTTSSVIVSSISLGTVGTSDFNNTQVKGVYYKATGNTNGFTILYKK